jgi:hypothetical protein
MDCLNAEKEAGILKTQLLESNKKISDLVNYWTGKFGCF